MKEGDSEEYIEELYVNEFNVKKIDNIEVTSMIDDFIYNYDTDSFSIANLSFVQELDHEIMRGHSVIGGIESGFISYERSLNKFYTSYADDVEGTISMICEGDDVFFEILLVVAEYSRDFSENTEFSEENFDEEKEAFVEKYIEKCRAIYPYGYYDLLFD